MSQPLNILGVDQFKTEVLDEKLPVLVDFWAPWCGPCQMMAPVLENIAQQFEGKLKVAKVDTEQSDNRSLAFDYQIMSIPNLKLFIKVKLSKILSALDRQRCLPANLTTNWLKLR